MGDFNRDRWGRPLVSDPAGGAKPVSYKRPSGYGRVLDDTYALNKWQQRTALVGAAKRPDLLAQVAATAQEEKQKGQAAELDKLVEECMEAAGGSEGRRLGDALHKYIAMVNAGKQIDVLAPWDADVAAYQQLLAKYGLRPVPGIIEVALVNDRFEAAGSADLFLEEIATGDVFAADLKTGKSAPVSNVYLVQLTIYATSQRYDTETGERLGPIHSKLRTDKGLLIHVPAGTATASLYGADLVEGLRRTIIAQELNELVKDTSPIKLLASPSTAAVETIPEAAPALVAVDNPWQHLVWRLDQIVNHPQGKKVLAEKWMNLGVGFPPKDLQQAVDASTHPSADAAHLEMLRKAQRCIEHAEKLLSLPFVDPPAPPFTPEPAPEQPAEPAPVIDFEGDQADPAAVKALAAALKELPEQMQVAIKAIAAGANKAKGSIALRQNPTVRRFEIGRTLVKLAQWCDDASRDTYEDTVRAVLDHIGAGSSDDTLGVRIAHIDSFDAAIVAMVADHLADEIYQLGFGDDGRARVVTA